MIDFSGVEVPGGCEYVISACLCGVCCRYDGKTKCIPEIRKIYDEGRAVLVCPEVMGGMPTPRKPSEIQGDRVVNSEGEDTTEFFRKGAVAVLEICLRHNIRKAILKQRSPSCGSKQVYDGSFSGRIVDGAGITASLLKENGIEVFGEDDGIFTKF